MESSHPVERHVAAQQLLDSLLHLAGGLVGERHGEDPVRLHVVVRNQVGDLVRDGTGLSRTRTRQD